MTHRRRAAVLGSPIGHSLSPVLHRAAYAELGLDWSYDAIECPADGLAALWARVRADPAWAGLSLTMPLKTAVLPLLDEVSELARTLGAVNTVVLGDGRAVGHNTDVAGVRVALAELGVAVPAAGAVVLGGGGTARAVLAALAGADAQEVAVVLRRPEAGAELIELGVGLDLAVRVRSWDQAFDAVAGARLVVATTPAGVPDELAARGWPRGVPLLDVLYAPWPTALARAASAAGVPVVGGLPLLVGQAAEQVSLMTSRPAPVAAMRAAGEAALATRPG